MINSYTKTIFSCLFFLTFFSVKHIYAADSLKVLFIGNSYTSVNNLPQTVQAMADADGKYLEYSTSTPGGSTLQQHCNNATTQSLLQQGDWDYVVLQEQSQLPAFPDSMVEAQFYTYAKELDSLVHVYTPCAKTVFYITWGRKNGDMVNCASFPPICTYDGMDSMLTLRYSQIAHITHAYLSPVGPLWHVIRDQLPNTELYQSDESHPTEAGTFAAACSFYAVLFGANIENNNFPSSLPMQEASEIKTLAQIIVADSLDYWRRFYSPVNAVFSIDGTGDNGSFNFINQSYGANQYSWDFGDGQTSTQSDPTHVFNADGEYVVCLTATNGCDTAQYCDTVQVATTGINSVVADKMEIFPNPVVDRLHIMNSNSKATYAVHDIFGRMLKSGDIPDGGVIVVGDLDAGMYFLTLMTPAKRLKKQVVKFQKL